MGWLPLGLKILPHSSTYAPALGASVAIGVAFGAYMALADATVFHSVIPASQTAMISESSPLQRIAYFIPAVIFDEVVFRLILVSALVWLLGMVAGLRALCFWAAIVFAAVVAYPAFHLSYLASLSLTPLTVSREILLHGAAGVLWGYLYWKHGWLAGLAGHISAHFSLQPMLSLLFFH
jgi:hypothetical protein